MSYALQKTAADFSATAKRNYLRCGYPDNKNRSAVLVFDGKIFLKRFYPGVFLFRLIKNYNTRVKQISYFITIQLPVFLEPLLIRIPFS